MTPKRIEKQIRTLRQAQGRYYSWADEARADGDTELASFWEHAAEGTVSAIGYWKGQLGIREQIEERHKPRWAESMYAGA
ncbi:MAG: hypothetical protein EOM24_16250 [Chloroflexia bacterium]|nr:hypothetical protein [Chloroflexia bacterium]